MTDPRSRAAVLALLVALAGCSGSLSGQGGPDAGPDVHPTPALCSSLSACACYTNSDRCTMRTEACWCPSECDPNIACVCGGGQFLGCQDKATARACDAESARVQTLCAGRPFTSFLAGICSTDPTCMAACLQQLETVDSCTQIDCSFCTTCDCLSPSTPSPLRICINNCSLPPPPLR
jgi:hypothetical protein